MTTTRCIGVDPGPQPGFVALDCRDGQLETTHVVQCSADTAVNVLLMFLGGWGTGGPVVVQIERFVVGNRSSRSSSAGAGGITRYMIVTLRDVFDDSLKGSGRTRHWIERSAGNVKPWATDERLEKAGLLAPVKGMTHAKDAGRHALFAAVHGGVLPDPLSKNWGKAS